MSDRAHDTRSNDRNERMNRRSRAHIKAFARVEAYEHEKQRDDQRFVMLSRLLVTCRNESESDREAFALFCQTHDVTTTRVSDHLSDVQAISAREARRLHVHTSVRVNEHASDTLRDSASLVRAQQKQHFVKAKHARVCTYECVAHADALYRLQFESYVLRVAHVEESNLSMREQRMRDVEARTDSMTILEHISSASSSDEQARAAKRKSMNARVKLAREVCKEDDKSAKRAVKKYDDKKKQQRAIATRLLEHAKKEYDELASKDRFERLQEAQARFDRLI